LREPHERLIKIGGSGLCAQLFGRSVGQNCAVAKQHNPIALSGLVHDVTRDDQSFSLVGDEQPWADLGLKEDEYARIREILGRRPTIAELAMYSVMWSEHCSYKSSKVHLRDFGETSAEETPRGKTLAGIGENAGVIDIGQGWAVTFKVESHNHPSLRRALPGRRDRRRRHRPRHHGDGRPPGRGHGPAALRRHRRGRHPRVLPGVVKGVGGYGNCLGLPNIGGEIVFDDCYQGNPLVNALCVGKLRHEDLHLAKPPASATRSSCSAPSTGGDGIGGVSVLASETFDEGGPTKRPSVQVGDPFMPRRCSSSAASSCTRPGSSRASRTSAARALLRHLRARLRRRRRHAHRARPRAAARLHPPPEEILMSESQERMMAVVEPDQVDAFMAICAKWDVEATVARRGHRQAVGSSSPGTARHRRRAAAHRGPRRPGLRAPVRPPGWLDDLQADTSDSRSRGRPEEMRQVVLDLLASPNICDKSWVTDQYDRYVLGNTKQASPPTPACRAHRRGDRPRASRLDRLQRPLRRLDPYAGAQLALAESYRNVATSGALPLAVTDCLNFGSPEDPDVMWQFERSFLVKPTKSFLGRPGHMSCTVTWAVCLRQSISKLSET
jgi:phosphoribosylformylglycinamidine (FGAM) synthase-like enzyme